MNNIIRMNQHIKNKVFSMTSKELASEVGKQKWRRFYISKTLERMGGSAKVYQFSKYKRK